MWSASSTAGPQQIVIVNKNMANSTEYTEVTYARQLRDVGIEAVDRVLNPDPNDMRCGPGQLFGDKK